MWGTLMSSLAFSELCFPLGVSIPLSAQSISALISLQRWWPGTCRAGGEKAYLTSGQVHPIWQTGLRRMVTKNKLHVPHATCSSAPLPLQQLMGHAQPMCDTSLAAQMESKSLESEDSMELWKTWLQEHSFSISTCYWRTSLILAPANLGYAMILWTLFAASQP